MPDCLFCRIASKEIPAQLIHEDERAIAFKDINPQAPTHFLVVPRRHIQSLAASEDGDVEILGHLQRVAALVAKKGGVESFRVVTNSGRGAGQSVDHLHYHVLGGRAMKWPPG